MTRSQQKHLSRRDAFNKNVRHKAQHEGVSFPAALTSKLKELNGKPATPRVIGYNVPAAHYNSSRRNPAQVALEDDDVHSDEEQDDYDYEADDHPSAPSPTPSSSTPTDTPTVNLLDIAKFAKPKGPAKDFHIVPVRNVIVLDDETHGTRARWEDDQDQDWEEIYDVEHRFIGQPSYSEVLTQWAKT